MNNRRWMNRSQPQTLYSAVLLCYISGGFLLFGSRIEWQLALDVFETIARLATNEHTAADLADSVVPPLLTLLLGGCYVAGGMGTASERNWGHRLCTVAAVYSLMATFWWVALTGLHLGIMMRLLFDVLLLVLLFHPISRSHRRVWFQ